MRVCDLPPSAVSRAFRTEGLTLGVGPFVIRQRVPDEASHAALTQLYKAFPVVEDEAFVDISMTCVAGVDPRAWWRREHRVYIDGNRHAAFHDRRHIVPMLEWATNWAVATRPQNLLILHAAVAARDDRALVIPAPPGSGKSTLCAALVARGWRLLSDEFTLLRTDDGMVVPCPRPISLKNQSIDVMRALAPTAVLDDAFAGTPKGTISYVVPPAASVAAQAEVAEPAWIVFPAWRSGSAPQFAAVAASDCFARLIGSAVNYGALGEVGFRLIVGLAQRCAAHDFTYDSLDDAVDALESRTA